MKIQATFYPGISKNDLESGAMSEISWQRLHPFLEQAFNIREGEKLVGITVTEYGVKAKFEMTNQTP